MNFYKTITARLINTDGVHAMAEERGAFWLIDAVASYQGQRVLANDPMLRDFQIWTLAKNKTGNGAVLECRADTNTPVAIRQRIEYTDFFKDEPGTPEPFKMYVERGETMVLMLPDER